MTARAPSAARVPWAVSGLGLLGGSAAGSPLVCTHTARPLLSSLCQGVPRLRPSPVAAAAGANAIWRPRSPGVASASASFSTSAVLAKRRRYNPRDHNPLRGVSSIRRSGPREFLSVSDDPLPRPARTAATEPEVDPEHGLWQFFYDKQVAQTPIKDAEFGRAWTVEELRRKSWDDLHRLWWVCVKERNRIATASVARKHFDLGFGQYEADERDGAVKQTMRGIKHVLTERFYVWEDAVDLAETDPEIDLSGEGPAFQPAAYLEEEEQQPHTAGDKAGKQPQPQPLTPSQ